MKGTKMNKIFPILNDVKFVYAKINPPARQTGCYSQ